MFALGGLFLLFLIVGICVLAAKALFALALIPFKIGFGIVKWNAGRPKSYEAVVRPD